MNQKITYIVCDSDGDVRASGYTDPSEAISEALIIVGETDDDIEVAPDAFNADAVTVTNKHTVRDITKMVSELYGYADDLIFARKQGYEKGK